MTDTPFSLNYKNEYAIEAHDMKCAILEALTEIESNKLYVHKCMSPHEVAHNAGVQRDIDIITKHCGAFL